MQVYQGTGDPLHPGQGLFYQPGTGRAGHATQQQSRAEGTVRPDLSKRGSQLRVVVDQVLLQVASFDWLRAFVEGGTLLVEGVEPAVGDKGGHRAATGAAHGPRFPAYINPEVGAWRNRLTAMKTAGGRDQGRAVTGVHR